ncbi:hypothetical protein QAD02_022641 [Eretmocerus hayati]|uniref:Uncharacterized protein n=1 Tax=Eretmocerus hayati TaxID=131215 RepID=A0ACC2PWW3_9HYME|nr:hypothetical protein QAD02_022641 [Eretmocerus hayati]
MVSEEIVVVEIANKIANADNDHENILSLSVLNSIKTFPKHVSVEFNFFCANLHDMTFLLLVNTYDCGYSFDSNCLMGAFTCQTCHKTYQVRSSLLRHARLECIGRIAQYACPYCQYRAKRKDNLRSHVFGKHKTNIIQ